MSKAKKQDLTKEVMKEIHEGRVKMRPRIYFVAGSLLLGAGLAGAVLLATIFVNLAFFRLRIHDPLGYLRFGRFGWGPFFATFPWLPFLLSFGGIIGGLLLLRHYDISYKKNLLGLTLGLVGFVIVAGLVLNFSGFNERIGQFEQPERPGELRRLPLYRPPLFQDQFTGEAWVVGEIASVEDQEMSVVTPEGDEVTIIWDKTTLLPFGSDFAVGETVRAVGEWQDETTFAARGLATGGMRPWSGDGGVKGLEDRRIPKVPPRWR